MMNEGIKRVTQDLLRRLQRLTQELAEIQAAMVTLIKKLEEEGDDN